MTTEGDLKIWHITNVDDRIGGQPRYIFERPVKDIAEAELLLNVLADYCLSLDALVDSDAQGLLVYERDKEAPGGYAWTDWLSDEGYLIGEEPE